jgi:hypothetical protein
MIHITATWSKAAYVSLTLPAHSSASAQVGKCPLVGGRIRLLVPHSDKKF